MLIYQLFMLMHPFCLLINVSQSKHLQKSPLKFTYPVILQLSDYSVIDF